jgi:hypothetical protein
MYVFSAIIIEKSEEYSHLGDKNSACFPNPHPLVADLSAYLRN